MNYVKIRYRCRSELFFSPKMRKFIPWTFLFPHFSVPFLAFSKSEDSYFMKFFHFLIVPHFSQKWVKLFKFFLFPHFSVPFLTFPCCFGTFFIFTKKKLFNLCWCVQVLFRKYQNNFFFYPRAFAVAWVFRWKVTPPPPPSSHILLLLLHTSNLGHWSRGLRF